MKNFLPLEELEAMYDNVQTLLENQTDEIPQNVVDVLERHLQAIPNLIEAFRELYHNRENNKVDLSDLLDGYERFIKLMFRLSEIIERFSDIS